MADEQGHQEHRLNSKGAKYIETALGKAMPDAAFSFALILSIITALAPVLGKCFGSTRRVRKSIKTGDDTFLVANFRAANSQGLSPAESVGYALEMRTQCKDATDDDIDEFIGLCVDTNG